MKKETKGWVIIAENHSSSGSSYINETTFSRTRKEAISYFVHGSGYGWGYWKRKYNFKAVKAKRVIETDDSLKSQGNLS